jgi:hypothetical protein
MLDDDDGFRKGLNPYRHPPPDLAFGEPNNTIER